MLLEELLKSDSNVFLEYTEIFLGGNTKTYSTYSSICDIPEAYRTTKIDQIVPICGVENVPWTFLEIENGQLHKKLCNGVFPVHPLEGQRLASISQGVIGGGTPLSNVRTLVIKELDAFPEAGFIKLSVPRRISRFQRQLHDYDVIHEIACSAQLDKLRYAYLPSYGGGFLTTPDGGTIGFILRPRSLSYCEAGNRFLPIFSLYGEDIARPKDAPLLTQMIRSKSQDPLALTLESIVYPLVQIWIEAVKKCGILLSLHGQNALACFDESGNLSDIGFRGTHSFVISQAEGRIPELYLHKRCVIGENLCRPFEEVSSLMYDCFLGNHVFSYLEKLLIRDFGVNASMFENAVKEIFRECGGHTLPMPKGIYYYPKNFYGDAASKLRLEKVSDVSRWR